MKPYIYIKVAQPKKSAASSKSRLQKTYKREEKINDYNSKSKWFCFRNACVCTRLINVVDFGSGPFIFPLDTISTFCVHKTLRMASFGWSKNHIKPRIHRRCTQTRKEKKPYNIYKSASTSDACRIRLLNTYVPDKTYNQISCNKRARQSKKNVKKAFILNKFFFVFGALWAKSLGCRRHDCHCV